MDYTRQSSQPATVDLVRADLAEVWTVYGSEFSSPKRPASVSGISDMLDLEFIPTPGVRPSKARKKDPLPDMLVDILELSPSRKRERNDRRGKDTTNSRSSDSADGGISRNHPSQQTVTADFPINSRDRPTRRQGQSKGKAAASSATTRGLAKAPKQIKPTAKTANPAGTRAKAKARRDDGDVFELSDSTDTEAESRPKKRQAKQPSSANPRAPTTHEPRPAEKAAGPSTSQKGKPSRVPKKPSCRDNAEALKAEVGLPPSGSAPNQQEDRVIPLMTQWDSDGQSRTGRPASTIHNTMIAEAFTFSESPEASPIPMQENEPVVSARSKPLEVITVSSRSDEEGDIPERSTSPLFVSQDKKNTVSRDNPDILVTVKPGTDDDQRCPGRLLMGNTSRGFTPPAPSQAQLQTNDAGVPQQRGISCGLPSGFRDAFFSDEKPATVPSSPLPEPGPHSEEHEEENMNPEDVWKQAVEDDTPPEILHRIVTLLHRSLKPKEEIIRNIASDYERNAFRLLHNLSARHLQEKADTLAALWKASRAAFSVFSGAGLDLAIHMENLRELDIAYTADTLRRPALAEKLDAVARLCQTMLDNYHQSGPLRRTSSITDDAASVREEGNEKLDNLAETYRLKLFGAVRRPEDQVIESYDKESSRVHEYIRRCLEGETNKAHQALPKKLDGPARTADEALEALLNRMIGRMQGNGTEGGLDGNASGTVIDVLSEASDNSELAF